MNNKFIVLSDVHLGHHSVNHMVDQFHTVLKYCEEHEIHAMVICGDLFDRKLESQSEFIKIALWFIATFLSPRSGEYDYVTRDVILLQGTYSHDHDQLNLFEHLKMFGNVQIVKTVQEINFLGYTCLCLPEVYTSIDKKIFNEKYDYIFAHGFLEETAYSEEEVDIEKSLHNTPVYNSDLLSNISTATFIGHVHNRNVYGCNNNVYVPGSFVRNSFGEENDNSKGFLVVDDEDNSIIHVELNTYRYLTIVWDKDEREENDIDTILDLYNKARIDGVDFIRLKIKRNDLFSIIKALNISNCLVVKIGDKKNKTLRKKKITTDVDFFNDHSTSMESKIVKWYEEKLKSSYDNYDLTVDTVKEHM